VYFIDRLESLLANSVLGGALSGPYRLRNILRSGQSPQLGRNRGHDDAQCWGGQLWTGWRALNIDPNVGYLARAPSFCAPQRNHDLPRRRAEPVRNDRICSSNLRGDFVLE
jgi:hypothetical protein